MRLVIYLNYKGGEYMETWQMDIESFEETGCAMNND